MTMKKCASVLLLALLALAAASCSASNAGVDSAVVQEDRALELTQHYNAHDAEHEHAHEHGDVAVRCRFCGATVAYKKDHVELHDTSKAVASRRENVLGENAELYTFVNPSRAEFELVGFKKVVGLESEVFSKKATVFDDYSWRDVRCGGCKRHIGWAFYHDELQQCINSQLLDSVTAKQAHEKLLASTAEMERKAEIVRQEMEGQCILAAAGWWTYEICYEGEVRQFHEEPDGTRPSDWSMGIYVPGGQEADTAYVGTDVVQYFEGGQHCEENGELRNTKVVYRCCESHPKTVVVEKVDEPSLCSYRISVCIPDLCEPESEDEDSGESEQILEQCKAQFSTSHEDEHVPAAFAALRWATIISEDSSELEWARQMQFTV